MLGSVSFVYMIYFVEIHFIFLNILKTDLTHETHACVKKPLKYLHDTGSPQILTNVKLVFS